MVDQSAGDHADLPDVVGACRIRHLRSRTRGVGAARNRGIAAAEHDLLALLDDDVVVAPAWLDRLVAAQVGRGPRIVVTGAVAASASDGSSFAPSSKTAPEPALYEGRIGADVLYTGNMSIYRSAWAAVGGFDERLGTGARFPAAVDNDFGHRLLERGFAIAYLPEAVVEHVAWRHTNHARRLRWYYGRGQGAFYAKHLELRDGYMRGRLVDDARRHLLRAARRARHDRAGAGDDLAYTAGVVAGALEWLLLVELLGLDGAHGDDDRIALVEDVELPGP